MKFDKTVGPIGYLNQGHKLIEQTKKDLQAQNKPVIQCAKYSCWCGLCAPKAADLEHYEKIMEKYLA